MDGLKNSATTTSENEHSDRHYENDISTVFDELNCVSSILNSCKSIESISEFNRIAELQGTVNSTFSTVFQNLDGNKSNFDNFAVCIQQMKHKFSVIGLAETNTSPDLKDLYTLDGYTSFYQDIDPSKFKGTGVALYIHDSFNANLVKDLSYRTENLESIFVKIQIGNETYNIGVIYNPPSGDDSKFVNEFENILEMCPPKNVIILGDFNFDLHKLNSESSI